MARAPKMVNLSIEETSGVDHPAHLREGWLVVKAADPTAVDEVIRSLSDNPSPEEDTVSDTPESTTEKSIEDQLAEALAALEAATARITELEAAAAAPVTETVESDDDILKSAPEAVVKMLEDIRKERDAAQAAAVAVAEELRKERDAAADAAAIEKARGWYNLAINAESFGPALRRLSEADADLAKAVEEALITANAQAESGAMFAELGKSSVPATGDAFTRLDAIAKAAATNTGVSYETAFASAVSSNPDIYNTYLSEKGL